MQCLHPILISTTPVDKVTGEVGTSRPIYVPCRKCIACKSNRRSEWSFRLLHESLASEYNNYFITLTYTNENLPVKEYVEGYQPCFNKSDYQKFLKRLRKHYEKKCKIRFFLSTEYGDKTLRPHAHAVIFNIPDDLRTFRNVLESTWRLGRVQADCLNTQRMGYVSKYIMKQHFLDDLSRSDARSPFMLCSQGIGKSFVERYSDNFTSDDSLRTWSFSFDNVRVALPRYFKDKIFTEEQKAQIADNNAKYRALHPLVLYSDYRYDKQLEKHLTSVMNLRSKL